MDVRVERWHDVVICQPMGEITIQYVPQLRKTFTNIIHQDAKKVIVDFSSAPTIDTAGLATLIEMYHRLKKIQGHLKLSHMNAHIQRMFEVLKLCSFFDIYATRQEALNAFSS